MFKMINEDYNIEILDQYLVDNNENIPDFYNFGMNFLKDLAIEKGIVFDQEFRTHWNFNPEPVQCFDEEYFSKDEQRDFFVLCAAAANSEIFYSLAYIWENVHGEVMTEQVLQREIVNRQQKGITL